MPGSLGQKDFLNHEMIEHGKGGAGMVQVRVGHGRIFAHDVHAFEGAFMNGSHDFHHGQARPGVECGTPEIFIKRACHWVADRPIVGKDHGNQACIRGALHVVLATQRVKARAGFAYLTGEQGQGDQASRIVCAVNVL